MPTTNTTPATAIRNNIIPVGWALTVNDLSPPYGTWYVYRAYNYDVYMGVNAFPTGGSLFVPRFEVYRPPIGVNISAINVLDYPWPISIGGLTWSGANVPANIPLTPGYDHYVYLRHNTGLALVDASFEIDFLAPPFLRVPPDSIIIPDVGPGYPTIGVTPDGTVLQYVRSSASGEYGFSLPSGRIVHSILSETSSDGYLGFFEPNFSEIGRWPLPTTPAEPARHTFAGLAYTPSGTIYLMTDPVSGGENAQLHIFSSVGIHLATQTLSIPTASVSALGVSLDGTVAYFTVGQNNTIKRWDIVNETLLSDFVNLPTSYFTTRDIQVLPNGDILIAGLHSSTDNYKIFRYSSAAALLNSYEVFATALGFPRMSLYPLNMNLVVAMDQQQTGDDTYQLFKQLNLTTGAVTTLGTTPTKDDNGVILVDAGTLGAIPFFGASFSCPVFVAAKTMAEEMIADEEQPPPLPGGGSSPHECVCEPEPEVPNIAETPVSDTHIFERVEQCDGDGVVPLAGVGTLGDDAWWV